MAHKTNMRVIFDLALNHFSDQHRFYKDTLTDGRASKYWHYFARDEKGEATFYFDWKNLKNLNYDNAEVRQYIYGALLHWVKDFDVDGFRMDAAWAIKERAPDFWPQCLRDLKKAKPGLLMIAEASVLDPYYATAGFDCAYDWTDSPGKWAWTEAFDNKEPAPILRAALTKNNKTISVFRFLNNNDTGERFLQKHGEPLTRVAAAMLMTLPGTPCVYMGDETGDNFLPYGESQHLEQSNNLALEGFYKTLIETRLHNPALTSPEIELIDTGHNSQLLAYVRKERTTANAGGPDEEALYNCAGKVAAEPQQILVILNYSADTITMNVPQKISKSSNCENLLNQEPYALKSTIVVRPYESLILRISPQS